MHPMLLDAADMALPTVDDDPRLFWLGSIGIRDDGTIVKSKNGAVKFSTSVEDYQLVPTSHAEGRVLRKLGYYGTLFVARVSRKDGSLAMSAPCPMCSIRIKSFKVKKVYYTINSNSYGIWNVVKDTYIIHSD